MQDNPIQLLRDASERARSARDAYATDPTVPAWHLVCNAEREEQDLAVNFTRSILDGSFPDEAAVERAARAMCASKHHDLLWDRLSRTNKKPWLDAASAALRAALGDVSAASLTSDEQGGER